MLDVREVVRMPYLEKKLEYSIVARNEWFR